MSREQGAGQGRHSAGMVCGSVPRLGVRHDLIDFLDSGL